MGCYFIATSTTPNWLAKCASGTATTSINTGIASTTGSSGAGVWGTFRIDGDGNNVIFYARRGPTSTLQEITKITGASIPTVPLNAGIFFGRTFGTQAIQFDWKDMSFSARRVPPPLTSL